MKYCIHCGKEVLDDAVICPACGCSVKYDMPNGGSECKNGVVPPYADTYSSLSIVGFVLVFFTLIVGLIVSIIANNEAKRTGSLKSQSLSKAGIIISSVMLGFVGVMFILFFIIICVGLVYW